VQQHPQAMVVAAVEDAPSAASTRTRRTLMDDMAQEERRKAEGQQKKQEDASRAQSYRSSVDTFNAGMEELVTKVIDRYSRLLPPDDPTMEALRGTAFPDILTGASALAEELSIADAEAARKHLKTQENFLQLKLNRSRAAGKVEMKNYTAEMEAAHARAIAEQAAALADGSVLKEIQDQLNKLTEEHNSLKNKYDRAEVLPRRWARSSRSLSRRAASSARSSLPSRRLLRMSWRWTLHPPRRQRASRYMSRSAT